MVNEPLRVLVLCKKIFFKNSAGIIKNTGYFDPEQMVQCENGNGEKTVKCLSQHQKLVVSKTDSKSLKKNKLFKLKFKKICRNPILKWHDF